MNLGHSTTPRPLTSVDDSNEPRRIRTFGVVGAGLMATQLALLIANKLRIPVMISDIAEERVAVALERVHGHLERQESKGRLQLGEASKIAALVRGTTDMAEFSSCDATIEAVFEELTVKRTVFQQLEEVIRPGALLLTNTSSLSVGSIARGLRYPERVLGFHFFNPVAVLPLIELVKTPFSSEATLTEATHLAALLGKTAICVDDKPGFVVNRLLTRLFCELLEEIDAGEDLVAVDRSLDPWGLPMTPLNLIGYIGPSVQQHICETMHHAYSDRFPLSACLRAVVESGLPGFFDENGIPWAPASAVRSGPHGSDAERIRRRVRDALADEAHHMLIEGVVATQEDIDRCMTLGANFPAGGLTRVLAM